jgi:hypothetical protein
MPAFAILVELIFGGNQPLMAVVIVAIGALAGVVTICTGFIKTVQWLRGPKEDSDPPLPAPHKQEPEEVDEIGVSVSFGYPLYDRPDGGRHLGEDSVIVTVVNRSYDHSHTIDSLGFELQGKKSLLITEPFPPLPVTIRPRDKYVTWLELENLRWTIARDGNGLAPSKVWVTDSIGDRHRAEVPESIAKECASETGGVR